MKIDIESYKSNVNVNAPYFHAQYFTKEFRCVSSVANFENKMKCSSARHCIMSCQFLDNEIDFNEILQIFVKFSA